MAPFQPFIMERMMSKYEKEVDYNISESGVHPATLKELLGDNPELTEKILNLELNYAHANGIPELRKNIASRYKGASDQNILVTIGAIEANYNTIKTLLSPGDEIMMMLPNYMQIWGTAKNYNLDLKTFHLQEEKGWAPDLDELNEKVTEKTRLIAVCNPNNPTGYILTEEEMDSLIRIADKAGAWILADEVYTVERHPDLAEDAEELLQSLGYSNIHIVQGDGTKGLPEHAPYQAVIVTAAAPEVPQPLLDQLDEHGRLIMPVGGRAGQILQLWTRHGDRYHKESLTPVAFVPLIGEHGHSAP